MLNSAELAQWLSGRVLGETEKPWVRASLASLRCGLRARHIYPRLVLVQPRKTPPRTLLLMGRKESNQTTQLSTKFILLINVKMPTIVDILTFISMINTTSERHKASNFFFCRYFSFYEQLKFRAQLVEDEKSFMSSGPDLKNDNFEKRSRDTKQS